ncbi:hypothetical protein OBBRIDRAFT_277346 [Obba rivulosa]|uniref:Uncharacterized protein n=1 Tax=Obba rivulosa TaxID=1052685 RepID=A0A8E2J301_9APHY|nr:hypothetical protein OBBRIDRAFT_277346 [Obba rivulosa]
MRNADVVHATVIPVPIKKSCERIDSKRLSVGLWEWQLPRQMREVSPMKPTRSIAKNRIQPRGIHNRRPRPARPAPKDILYTIAEVSEGEEDAQTVADVRTLLESHVSSDKSRGSSDKNRGGSDKNHGGSGDEDGLYSNIVQCLLDQRPAPRVESDGHQLGPKGEKSIKPAWPRKLCGRIPLLASRILKSTASTAKKASTVSGTEKASMVPSAEKISKVTNAEKVHIDFEELLSQATELGLRYHPDGHSSPPQIVTSVADIRPGRCYHTAQAQKYYLTTGGEFIKVRDRSPLLQIPVVKSTTSNAKKASTASSVEKVHIDFEDLLSQATELSLQYHLDGHSSPPQIVTSVSDIRPGRCYHTAQAQKYYLTTGGEFIKVRDCSPLLRIPVVKSTASNAKKASTVSSVEKVHIDFEDLLSQATELSLRYHPKSRSNPPQIVSSTADIRPGRCYYTGSAQKYYLTTGGEFIKVRDRSPLLSIPQGQGAPSEPVYAGFFAYTLRSLLNAPV